MPAKASTSTLKWCREEAGPIFTGLRLLLRSQLGYEGRKIEDNLSHSCLKLVVGGGSVIDPSRPKQSSPSTWTPPESVTDVLQRTNAVATGIRTYAELIARGIFPGTGGYTVSSSSEKVFGHSISPSPSVIAGLSRLADLISKGSIALPNIPLPNLQRLGEEAQEKPLFKDSDFVKSKFSPGAKLSDTQTDLTPSEEEFLLKAAQSVDDMDAAEKLRQKSRNIYRPTLPANYTVTAEETADSLSKSKESKVPSTRIGRLASFGQLAVGLAGGAAAEVTRRTLSFGSSKIIEGMPSNPFLSSANADRIVQTLCRVRGAALKLGQMLSIQDPDTVPAALLEIFERVRHSADFMPLKQVEKQMIASFGKDWRSQFRTFEDRPFAAASIGQVHKAVLLDGRKVAVKIQYPGVAEGIDSDIDNLVSVLSIGNLFPKGLFLEKFVEELAEECDYMREARAMKKFRELLAESKDFFVPEVVDSLTTIRVLTAEYVVGKPVDKCVNEPQVVRDYIAGKFIELCLHEIFVWRFMQTDPNWSNFFLGVHPVTGEPRMVLLDFGASRPYRKKFVDLYMRIIKAASDGDTKRIIEHSREIGFLTGYETEVMEDAHAESVLIMGETLASNRPFDFSRQSVTKRIHKLIPVMLEHRLTSPPEEIYSLHRKLSGSYLLATKLKAVVSCGGLFNEIYDNYKFGEDGKDIDIDSPAESLEQGKL
ncbi:ABC1 family protein [Necator americanus]|uniref:ABC1 family protein n=1 Tax=Necator americanus TaxID=51031 RepID=W2SX17_NECAM|nr:ABC1 family protein [Necator americanus]ETN74063.1 ABC1 family protein [Necator americanus]